MISDSEMITAFMGTDGAGYFSDNYPCLLTDVQQIRQYNQLVLTIMTYLIRYEYGDIDTVPDWVYSYMIGSTISVNSDKLDIHDLAVQLGTGTVSDSFTPACSEACLRESINDNRGYTFQSMNINEFSTEVVEKLKTVELIYNSDNTEDLYSDTVVTLYDLIHNINIGKVYDRPPTMFGEPHVLRSLRLQQIAM